MAFPNTKVYFDGSHYIGIPHEEHPERRKKNKMQADEKKAAFETAYAESKTKKKAERTESIVESIKDKFESEEQAREYVEQNAEWKRKNLAAKRTRLYRKVNMQEWSYFATFTYDDKKQDEVTFRRSLANCLKHLSSRKGWKYIGVWERGSKTERLHFHDLLYSPDGTVVGELIGKNTGVLNEATKEGNQSIEELKRGTAVKAVKEKQAELKAAENKITALKWADNLTPLKEKRDCVVLSKQDYESAKVALIKKYLLESRATEAETKAAVADKERQKAVDRNYENQLDELKKTIYGLEHKQYSVLSDNRKLENELDKIYKVLDENPQLREHFIQLTNEMEQMQL